MLKIVGTTLAAAAFLASAAHADPNLIRKDVSVAYSDLDLSTEGGAKQLIERIQLAAAQACGGSPYFYSSYTAAPGLAIKEFNTCRTNAISAAVTSVKAPMVQKLFASAEQHQLMIAGK